MCYNQTGDISTLEGTPLKLVDKFTYLGSSVESTEKDIETRLTKAWTAINRLSIIWKSDLTDKMKRSFFQAAVTSILLYGCTIIKLKTNKFWSIIIDQDSISGRVTPKTQKKLYLMPPCLKLSIIRFESWVKRSNQGKGVLPSITNGFSSYWKVVKWLDSAIGPMDDKVTKIVDRSRLDRIPKKKKRLWYASKQQFWYRWTLFCNL